MNKLQIKANLSQKCVLFLHQKLAHFDQTELEYFRLCDRTNSSLRKGVWGRCSYPSRKKGLGYRIRCCASIAHREFPYRARWAVGTRQLNAREWEWVWRNEQFQSKEEAFVWLAGHEAFHWLRHSRQIPGKNYETQANRSGFSWLDEWRSLSEAGERKSP